MKSILQVLNEGKSESQLLKMLGNVDYDRESKITLLEFCDKYANTLKIFSGSFYVDGGAFHIEWTDTPKMLDMVYNFSNEQATINGEKFTWKDFQKLAYGKNNWLIEVAERFRK